MSASPFIPREKLSAYQRWELNSFSESPQSATGRPRAEPRRPAPDPQSQREGYEAGYREGREAARRDGEVQLAAQGRHLGEVITAAHAELGRLDRELADGLLALAMRIAEQVVRASLDVRPELMLGIVEDALRQIAHSSQPSRLILHPDDAALLTTSLATQLETCHCTITPDPSLARGGCRIESAHGGIDATLETRWQRMAMALGQAPQSSTESRG